MKYSTFQEIFKPITRSLVESSARLFNSDYDYERLKTYEHLQAIVYAQLSQVSSLRTLEASINSQKIGVSVPICRSTLSDANRKRSSKCFSYILKNLLTLVPLSKKKEFSNIVRLLDSSPIQLKGYGYEWAKPTATRRCTGLKLHVEYDLGEAAPTRVELSHANFNDSSMGKVWPIEEGIVYVFDKGYCDYNWWFSINQKKAFFVTRLKSNAAIEIKKRLEIPKNSCVLEDTLFEFSNPTPRGGKKNTYNICVRRICVKREEKEPLVLVTNLLNESAKKIAELYKSRWAIELFFKWIKQRLKIKRFLGKSENAVKIQLICAIIGYLLIYLFKNRRSLRAPLYLIITWITTNLVKQFNSNSDYLNAIKRMRAVKINDS